MDYSKFYNFCLESYAKLPYVFGQGYAFRPMTLFIELTYRCNFRCNMCQFLGLLEDSRLNEKKGEELTAGEIRSAIDSVSRFGIVMFTGGEPFLRSDIMELVRYASTTRKSYIVTNGILLDNEKSDELTELGCANLFSNGVASVGVSLEAIGAVHDEIVKVPGSFEKIVSNIRYLVKARKKLGKRFPVIGLKCVMTKHNVGQLIELYRLAEDIGVDIFNPIAYYSMPNTDRHDMGGRVDWEKYPQSDSGVDIEILKESISEMKRHSKNSAVQLRITPPGIGVNDVIALYENRMTLSNKICYSPWTTAVLSAYGEVFPCSNYSVGSVRDGKRFLDIWNGEKMREFRLNLKKRHVFPACAGCCFISTDS